MGGKKKKKDKKHGAADASFDLSSFDMSPPPIARSGSRSSGKEKKSPPCASWTVLLTLRTHTPKFGGRRFHPPPNLGSEIARKHCKTRVF